MKGVAKVLHPQRGYGFKPRVAGAGRRLPWELPPPLYPNPNGVASVPESIPDVFLALRQSGMTRFGVRHRSASIGNRSLIYDLRFLKWEVPEGVPFAILLLAWDLQDDAC